MEHAFDFFENHYWSHQTAAILNKDYASNLQGGLPGRNRLRSVGRLAQQNINVKVAEFVLSLTSLLVASNRNSSKTTHASFILSNILKNAITYTGTGFGINYRKVLVTHGALPPADVALAKAGSACINFAWNNSNEREIFRRYDKAILVVYCETLNKCVYIFDTARRREEEAFLEVPQFHRHKVQTWLSFISMNGKFISDSTYTGEVTVT